jgi:hypothetical protein
LVCRNYQSFAQGLPRILTQIILLEPAQWWGNPAETTEYYATCAATLIHSDILLTAAHCNGIVNNINVLVGAYYPYSSIQGNVRTVIDRAIHPDFNAVTIENDFLVLKLDSPVPSIAPVVLNGDRASPSIHESLIIIGVGQMNETGDPSQTLLQVSVDYIDPTTCSDDYRNVSTVSPTMKLCTGVPGGGKGGLPRHECSRQWRHSMDPAPNLCTIFCPSFILPASAYYNTIGEQRNSNQQGRFSAKTLLDGDNYVRNGASLSNQSYPTLNASRANGLTHF